MHFDPYLRRRREFCSRMGNAVAVIPGARERIRSNDTEYEFRQHSDFFYLTGFLEPDAVLVLTGADHAVLFLRKSDRTQETWTGKRLGVDAAPAALHIDEAYPIEDIDARLPGLLAGTAELLYAFGDETFDRRVLAALDKARSSTRRAGRSPECTRNPALFLHEMRLRKEPEEIALLRQAAAITAEGHRAGVLAARPGAYEYQIQAEIECAYRRGGAVPAYTSIVAGGANATTLHYTANREQLRDGDLILVDSGAECGLYCSDVTRTWPVNGRFTGEQRAIYEIVLAAQNAAIEQLRPGNSSRAFHEAAVAEIAQGLRDLGLLHGSIDEIVEKERYREFYMHGTGHWLGLDVHDVGRYRNDDDTYRPLEPGMVTTVEPGIYVRADSDADDRFKGIGIRIEDDILVTADGYENLTAAIPRRIEEIERALAPA